MSGKLFHRDEDVVMPENIAHASHRYRLGSGKGREIDLFVAIPGARWVCQSKWHEDRAVNVDVLKELPATLILRPFNFNTLAIRTYELAKEEPVPQRPLPLPDRAPHLHSTFSKTNPGQRLNSTIDPFWQERVSKLAERHQSRM